MILSLTYLLSSSHSPLDDTSSHSPLDDIPNPQRIPQ